MSLIKHSQRTVRKPCKFCNSMDLYWAHDTDVHGDRWCTDCETDGKFVLINRDGSAHKPTCTPPDTYVPADAWQGAVSDEEIDAMTRNRFEDAHEPAPAPQINAETSKASQDTSDAAAALALLMESLSPRVDTEEIRTMIKTELDAIVFPTRTVVERANGSVQTVEGSHAMLGEIVTDLLAGLHVMMVGPAGTGKSTLAESAAQALDIPFYSLSLSPMTPNSAILGYNDASGNHIRSLFREAYEHGGVFLFDEIDNSHPSALAVVNAALANGTMAFPDGMVKRHEDFRCVASANTYGRGADRQYVGRQQMDAATLDRFAVETINVDEALEHNICAATGLESSQVNKVLTYTRKLRKSAEDKGMRVMVSPRASIGMCKLLKAGKGWSAASEAVLFKGMTDADRRKLEG